MKKNIFIVSTLLFVLLGISLAFNQNVLSSTEKETSKTGYLGVSVEPLSRSLKKDLKADNGVVITDIEVDSPADKYGLTEDDVIQKVNDIMIRRPSTLTRIIRKMAPGEDAKIVVIRDGKEKTLNVVIGRLKKSQGLSAFAFGRDAYALKAFGGRAFLGIQLFELNDELAQYFGVKPDDGVLILEVEEDSPAEKAGIKAGDVITKIDKEAVSEPAAIHEIISELDEDDEIEIEIIHKNSKKTMKVKLEEREDLNQFYFSPQQQIKKLKIMPKEHDLLNSQKPENEIKRVPPHINTEKIKRLLDDTI